MKLKVLRLYDDAWGTAVIASGGSDNENGKQGAFPIVSFWFPFWYMAVLHSSIFGQFTTFQPRLYVVCGRRQALEG